jgi:hypothetical protein
MLLSTSVSGYSISGNLLFFDLGDVDQATSEYFTLQLQIATDPLLVENNTPLILTSSITSITPELDLNDNISIAQTLPIQ